MKQLLNGILAGLSLFDKFDKAIAQCMRKIRAYFLASFFYIIGVMLCVAGLIVFAIRFIPADIVLIASGAILLLFARHSMHK